MNIISYEIKKNGRDIATFGAGCFWCVEAIFQQIQGVVKVTPGYSGGKVNNPTYPEVCTGYTGHAEVCQIIFDTDSISYDELLEIFFLIHDPTSLNQQGNDIGTQYRSVIFYHNAEQKISANEYFTLLNNSPQYNHGIVTEISPFTCFFKAEDFHMNYYNFNSKDPYCATVINPKLTKFQKVYKDKLKSNKTLN